MWWARDRRTNYVDEQPGKAASILDEDHFLMTFSGLSGARRKDMNRSCRIGLLLIASVLLVFSMDVSTQAQQPPQTVVPGYYKDLDNNVSAVRRGESIFYQRCSLCHLPRIRKPGTNPGPAPSLTGILKDANKDHEATVRDYILKGSEKMPGWQYGLKSAQIDDVMTYLKTL